MTRVLLGAAALFLLISLSFWLFASWWWANLFFAVLIGFAMQLGAGPSFLAGAGSSFLSWFISMYWINAGNGGLLLQKMRAVLGLPFGSDTGVMLFIALLGAHHKRRPALFIRQVVPAVAFGHDPLLGRRLRSDRPVRAS